MKRYTLGGAGGHHMGFENLRQQSIEQVLDKIQELATVASKDQVQSVMALVARCTIDLAENLTRTSDEMRKASDEIRATATEVRQFNDSTTALTKQLIRLNRVLTWATVVIAFGTFVAAAAAILTLLFGSLWPRALPSPSSEIKSPPAAGSSTTPPGDASGAHAPGE